MSNLARFEFYNNFDIWYDLYQENGGDPNYVINMMMFSGKKETSVYFEYECKYEISSGPFVKIKLFGYGDGMEYNFPLNQYNNLYGCSKYEETKMRLYVLSGCLYNCGNGSC